MNVFGQYLHFLCRLPFCFTQFNSFNVVLNSLIGQKCVEMFLSFCVCVFSVFSSSFTFSFSLSRSFRQWSP